MKRRGTTRKNGRNTITLAMVLLLAAPLLAAEAPEVLAKRILEAVDRPADLAHLPRCGDGALGLALAAADPSMVVHGQDADPAHVTAARASADSAGMLNRRLAFDPGGLTRLLPAARSSDLMVMANLKAEELTPSLPAPPIYNGLAVAHDGRVIVTLGNGSVCVIGKKAPAT